MSAHAGSSAKGKEETRPRVGPRKIARISRVCRAWTGTDTRRVSPGRASAQSLLRTACGREARGRKSGAPEGRQRRIRDCIASESRCSTPRRPRCSTPPRRPASAAAAARRRSWPGGSASAPIHSLAAPAQLTHPTLRRRTSWRASRRGRAAWGRAAPLPTLGGGKAPGGGGAAAARPARQEMCTARRWIRRTSKSWRYESVRVGSVWVYLGDQLFGANSGDDPRHPRIEGTPTAPARRCRARRVARAETLPTI